MKLFLEEDELLIVISEACLFEKDIIVLATTRRIVITNRFFSDIITSFQVTKDEYITHVAVN